MSTNCNKNSTTFKTLSEVGRLLESFNISSTKVGEVFNSLTEAQQKLVLSGNLLTEQQKRIIVGNTNLSMSEAGVITTTEGVVLSEEKATVSTFSLSSAFKGLAASLGITTTALGVITGALAVVAVGAIAYKKWAEYQEELRQSAVDASNTLTEQTKSVESYVERYKELQTALKNAKGDEQAVYSIKQDLLTLQNELNDTFGEEYGKLNLVTDAYKDQTEAIKQYSKELAQSYLNEHESAINTAKSKMESNNHYNLTYTGEILNSDRGAILKEIAESYKDRGISILDELGDGSYAQFSIHLNANAEDAQDVINDFMNDVREKAIELNDEDLFADVLEISSMSLNDSKNIINEYGDIYKKALLSEIATNDGLSNGYNQITQAVESYNEAILKSEDPYNDDSVKNAWNNLQTIKQGIEENVDVWGKYESVTTEAFEQANDSAYSFYQTMQNDDSISKLTNDLRGLSNTDLESMASDGAEDSFDKLCKAANDYGLEIQDVIDLLIKLGIIQGQIADESQNPDKTDISYNFKDFWSSIGDTEKATSLKEELFKLASSGELTGSKLKSLAKDNELLKSAMDSSGLSANKLAEKIRELNIDNIESDIKSFADALDKVKNKQSLTAEETANLIAKDNSLAGAVKKTKDGYILEKDALSKVVDSHKEKYNVAVSYEINETKKVIDRIKDRIDAYQKEIDALKEVSKARDDLGGTTSGSYSDTLAQLELEKKQEKDQKKYDKRQKKLKELMNSLNNIDTSTSTSNSKSSDSKVFDYIQIKIARLERLHSKYLDKASDGTKTLTERTKNYNKVLSITEKQINAQDKAIARYNKQLKKIGLDESIAKKIRNGAFDIDTLKGKKKDKAEKYQDIWEKKLDAQDKKADLKAGKSETERNKYQAEFDDLENKRKAEEAISDELKKQIELKEKIGDKNTSSDYSAINESILKQINNYKEQIPVLEKQLGTVKKGSDKWYEYKEAIDSVKDSISGLTQEMMDNATKGIEAIQNASDEYFKSLDDEDALNNAKKENALTADEKNSYIDNTIKNIQNRKDKYAQDSLDYLNEKNNSANLIKSTSNKVQKSQGAVFDSILSFVNSGQKIPEDILNQVTDANLLTNCYAYNSAITAYETNEATRKLYNETSKSDIHNAVIDKVNAINNEYDTKNAALDREEANIQQDIAENEAKGIGQSVKDYRKLIEIDEQRKKNAIDRRNKLEELLNTEIKLGHIATDQNGLVDENDQAYQEFMSSIASCDEEISNCTVSQINYNKAIKEMNVENYKTAISLLDSMIDKYKRLQSLADVHNSKLSDEDILAQIGLNDEKIAENNKYLSTIKDDIKTYLTNELHMSAKNVEEFINLLENSPHKLRGFMNDLGFEDFNEKTFPDLINNLNEYNSTMNDSNSLMVDQENQLDSLAQKRIDTLSEYLEALKKQKDYKDRIFAIEKAQYDLEKAKNNLTKKVWDGQQWVYTADTEAVQSAQEALDNTKFDNFTSAIEDMIDILEKFIKDFNIYDDNGNMINKPESILSKDVLGEYTIVDIDKMFADNGWDISKLSGLMSNIQYAVPNYSIPNINLPEIERNTGGIHNHYDKIELVLPNITDASTGADLAKSFVNELKNLPSYAKQYDWNR